MSETDYIGVALKCDGCGLEIKDGEWWVTRLTEKDVEVYHLKCYQEKYGGRVAG